MSLWLWFLCGSRSNLVSHYGLTVFLFVQFYWWTRNGKGRSAHWALVWSSTMWKTLFWVRNSSNSIIEFAAPVDGIACTVGGQWKKEETPQRPCSPRLCKKLDCQVRSSSNSIIEFAAVDRTVIGCEDNITGVGTTSWLSSYCWRFGWTAVRSSSHIWCYTIRILCFIDLPNGGMLLLFLVVPSQLIVDL